ncbi:MAG: trimeric intracellular cation channel family protein [Filomicrobium sp.]
MNWPDMIGLWNTGDELMQAFSRLLPFLDLASAAVFAITGALVASRKEMDILGFIWLGIVTGVGGGTLRDLLLDVPVFWVQSPAPAIVCAIVAILVFFAAPMVQSRYQLILWLDAVGMALVTVAGTAKALDAGVGSFVAVVMGVITAAVGGIIRDTLGQEPSILLRREIYVTAALLGAVSYVVFISIGLSAVSAAFLGFAFALTLRLCAITFGWSMPGYRPRPGRPM